MFLFTRCVKLQYLEIESKNALCRGILHSCLPCNVKFVSQLSLDNVSLLCTTYNFSIADFGEIKLTADDNLGDLQLGRVRQEYILDPDLRGILSWAVLDADKMIVYKDRELFLMTSVIYSEKFEVVGKRMQEVCTLSFSIFASSDSFQLKWLSSSRVSGELAFSDFSFSLVFSGRQNLVSNPHRNSQRF